MRVRRWLQPAGRQTVHRYAGSGLKVKAGMGAGRLAATGLGAGVGSGYAVVGIAGSTYGTAALASLSVLTLGPGFAIAGIRRAVNNGRVNRELIRRSSHLPLDVSPGDVASLDLFFPLAPSPQRVEIGYSDSRGAQILVIETSQPLSGLHLRPDAR